MYGLCVRGFLQEQMWKLEKCTAKIEHAHEQKESEAENEN
jgi:hypothetical protein